MPKRKDYHRCYYEGPVLQFGQVVAQNLKMETIAVSAKAARRNFLKQAKDYFGLLPSAMLELPGEIIEEVKPAWME